MEISHTWSLWSEGSNHYHELACLLLPLSLLLLLVSWYTRSIKNSPLPRGPRGFPLLGNLPSLKPELHTYFTHLAQTYGPIFKLNLGYKLSIVISSPSLAREVLKDQDATFANRDVPVAGRLSTYGGHDIIWSPYGPVWRMLRKVCTREMLSGATLDSVYSLRRREVRKTILYVYGNSGSSINVGEQMFLTLLNVITSMMWGDLIKDGSERASPGAEFRQAVSDITKLWGMPNVSDFYPGLSRFDLQGVEKQIKGSFLLYDQIFNSIIDKGLKMNEEGENEGKGNNGEEMDFVQFLLKLKDEGGDSKTPLTMTHLKALLLDMVVGGTDTTSTTVEWAIAEMMHNPETMRKAQDELESVVGKDNIVEESHIPKLNYLHAVMKEVLRLHPPLPLLIPHCPNLSCTVGGYMVPKGARVFVNVWAIHRDPSIWDRPSEFDPERFLNSKWDFSGNDLNYLPFGSGRRICLGVQMAERMTLYALASLLHSFDWGLPEGEKLDFSGKCGMVLKKAIPLIAIPKPRLSDPSLYV